MATKDGICLVFRRDEADGQKKWCKRHMTCRKGAIWYSKSRKTKVWSKVPLDGATCSPDARRELKFQFKVEGGPTGNWYFRASDMAAMNDWVRVINDQAATLDEDDMISGSTGLTGSSGMTSSGSRASQGSMASGSTGISGSTGMTGDSGFTEDSGDWDDEDEEDDEDYDEEDDE